ncbi:hypothetical protein JRI60_47625 [Archangium violaceum]|uniref:hypothetical protein n=1 Tax=Archangium violaceum TaxID=83451 RepID=UPI00195051F2|nr:hypothetical protein [Archangium violaceum]QRN96590.1 hypothetical protein JRI60_47625 [Archangium violaceum]
MNYRNAFSALVVGGLVGGWMNVAVAAEPGRSAADQNIDAQGNPVRIGSVQQSGFSTLAASSLACLELHTVGGGTWQIQAIIDPNSYPFNIIGGNISGTICNSPNWAVTGGTLGSSVTINASYTGTASCAGTASIVGSFAAPAAYSGTYGFNGSSTSFGHRILFKGWGPC